jgi:hypothetical protein
MKMNKNNIFGGLLLIILFLSTASALAETATLKDTSIDYVAYREVSADKSSVVYQIKITNIGDKEKSYELIPSTDVIKELGSYRIDPSYTLTLGPDQEETLYFYLSVEKSMGARRTIPVEIISGTSSTTINLVARPVQPFQRGTTGTNMFADLFKIVFSLIIIIILLMAIIMLFRRIRKKKENQVDKGLKSHDDEVQTYY